MKRRLANLSLRTQLHLLVLTALLPALCISVYSTMEHRRESIISAERNAYRMVDELAETERELIAGTRQMLGTLSVLPEVRNLDGAACSRLFAAIVTRYPLYTSIQAAETNGNVIASGRPQPVSSSIHDSKPFRDALVSRDFSPGEFAHGFPAKNQIFTYAQPVFSGEGKISAVLQVGVALEHLERLFSRARIPKGTTVVITDHSGKVLYRNFAPEQTFGQPDNPNLFQLMQSGGDRGIIPPDRWDPFGPLRAYSAIRHAPGAAPHMYVRVAIPEDVVNGVLARTALNLLLLMLAAVLALALSNMLGKRGIAEPVEHLVAVSHRMAEGDMSARAAIPIGQGEIGHLALAFNNMVESLATREKERDSAEEELYLLTQKEIEERAKSEAIIAAIGDGISIQSPDFKVLYQNEQHKSMVGNCIGKLCHEEYEHSDTICDGCPLAEAFADRHNHTTERTTRRPDGSQLHVEITASPVFNEAGEIIAGVEAVRDITRRKEMEAALIQSNEALREINREMRHFGYVVSHDLREPLRTITSFIQLFKRRYSDKVDKDADEFITFIVDGAARMQLLIDDLLQYSRVESRGKELLPVDAGRALQMALDNLNAAITESGATVTATALPSIMGDDVQLAQLFQNLIGNAIKFRSDHSPVITVSCSRIDGSWRFAVSDNGIGINPESFERIFDIFQKLHSAEQYEGTGIGLAICRKIVERHGGRIWVDSTPGNGSTFYFTLRGVSS